MASQTETVSVETALKSYQTITQCCEKVQQTKQALSLSETSLLYQSLLVLKAYLTTHESKQETEMKTLIE